MILSLGSMMDTGFYVSKSSSVHAASLEAHNLDSHFTVPEDDNLSSDILQEDKKTTEQSTSGEVMPNICRSTEEVVLEGDMPTKDDDLEGQSVLKIPPNLSKSKESNSEHVCTVKITSDPLKVTIPEDNSVVEIPPVLPADPEDHKESPIVLDNSQNVIEEVPSVDNSEDHGVKEAPSDPVEDSNPVNDATVETTLPFPSSLSPSENSTIYEKPEDAEDLPDGIASMFCRRKESNKEEEMIQLQDLADSDDHCVITIISRRSRHRAGS